MHLPATITMRSTLDPDLTASVLDLVVRAERDDGVAALNESALLGLRHPRPSTRHLVAVADGSVVGYAQREDAGAYGVGAVLVDPGHRRHGIGAALLRALIDSDDRPVQVWAMGDSAAARGLARRLGLRAKRELLVMERTLDETIAVPELPADLTIRPFRSGDEDDWLAVNARAFAHHPEQGRITRDDLDERMALAWFDPAGFLVAIRAEVMVGFHWTKQHPDRLGEVYVLGVDPDAGGHGLGRALLAAGLRHLQQVGNSRVELYVEGDHVRAVRLYSGYGFAVRSRDVMYVPG